MVCCSLAVLKLFVIGKMFSFMKLQLIFHSFFFVIGGRSRARLVFTLNMRVADTKEIFAD